MITLGDMTSLNWSDISSVRKQIAQYIIYYDMHKREVVTIKRADEAFDDEVDLNLIKIIRLRHYMLPLSGKIERFKPLPDWLLWQLQIAELARQPRFRGHTAQDVMVDFDDMMKRNLLAIRDKDMVLR